MILQVSLVSTRVLGQCCLYGNYIRFQPRYIQNFRKHTTLSLHSKHINSMISSSKPRISLISWCRRFGIKSGKPNSSKAVTLKKSELQRLLHLAKPEKWTLVGALGFLVVSSAVTMAVPFCVGRLIDIIYAPGNEHTEAKQRLHQMCILMAGVFLVGAICNGGRVYLINMAGQRITRTLRASTYAALLRQEVGFFEARARTGELATRLAADTALVGSALTQNLSDGLRSGVMVCAGVSMMDSLAQATQVAEERLGSMRTVRALGAEAQEERRFSSAVDKVLQLASKEAMAKSIFFAMTGLSGNAIILSVLYYGGSLVGSEEITVGALSAFLLYAAYVGISLGGLSSFYTELNRGLGAGTRLWELLDRKPAIPLQGGVWPQVPPAGDVVFEKVSFVYPSRPFAPILRELSLHLPAGCVTAVVGGSGSGKSTLAALLLRFYDPTAGTEPVLFSGSVRENLLYGMLQNPLLADLKPEASEEKLRKALEQAQALEFVKCLPDGLNTLVGERGAQLSGGQRQRLAIARALLQEPRVLILDEATSALDAHTEASLQSGLGPLLKERTVMVIAHRLSTIRSADQIAVLDGGRVAELGSYEELTARPNGVFSQLVARQAFVSAFQSMSSPTPSQEQPVLTT
ncbi:Multidrug resistance protein homolog 65 [Gryllus bimaculatus]|nr:Multidrug resistance protein homolog 65 [Gryllus bimaculatus]